MNKAAQEKILEAGDKAQRQFLKLDKAGDRALKDAYILAASNIQAAIEAATFGSPFARIEHLNLIKSQIQNTLQEMAYDRRQLFEGSFNAAIAIASTPVLAQIPAEKITVIAQDAFRFVHTFTNIDGLQLSDRLWRIDSGAKEAISRGIEQAIIQGLSAHDAAQSFIQRGEVVPPELLAKADSAKTAQLASNAKRYMQTVSYSNAKRVFRTELNRAYTKAYEASVFELGDFVIGTRFMLSTNHKRRDVCDIHANANLFGLGRGVYPEGKNPCPAHPQTTSYVVAVFADDDE